MQIKAMERFNGSVRLLHDNDARQPSNRSEGKQILLSYQVLVDETANGSLMICIRQSARLITYNIKDDVSKRHALLLSSSSLRKC